MKNSTKQLMLAVLMTGVSFSSVMAQTATVNSDPININGYLSEEEMVTDAELQNVESELQKQKNTIIINKQKKRKYNELSRSTEKLADVTEDMIVERKESQETIDRFNKKIDCLMAEGPKPGCEEFVKGQDAVVVSQAAPQQVEVVEAEVKKPEASEEVFGSTIKVLPYTGMTTFLTDNESLDAGLVAGFKLETNVNTKFSVGVGFNYTTLSTQDYGSNQYIQNGYYSWYSQVYNGRQIDYSGMNFDIYSKYFFVKNNRFRPYIGAGLGYNRNTLEYADNNNSGSNYNGYNYNYGFGNEEVNTSNVNLELMLGSEIKFTESIGVNVEFSYLRNLGGNVSSNNRSNYYSSFYYPDQDRLEDLSNEINDANIMSIFLGMLIEF